MKAYWDNNFIDRQFKTADLFDRILVCKAIKLGSIFLKESLRTLSEASVVSGYRVRLEFQGSRVQTLLRSMDFSGRKNPELKSSGRDVKLEGPESEISGSLKNLNPEKIGL